MAIKSKVNQKQEQKYPWIGTNSKGEYGNVYLFLSLGVGVKLSGDEGVYKIGSYREYISEDQYSPINGSVTLSNE